MLAGLQELIQESFPIYNELTPEQQVALVNRTQPIQYKAGDHIHRAGSECIGAILLLTGSLRAYMLSESGKEITLFRVNAGESCVLSAACVLHLITFDIYLDATTDVKLLAIDSGFYSKLLTENPHVEAFTYRQTAERFSDVMWVMQQVLFMSFDKRLAVFLLDETSRVNSDVLHTTHDEIAKHMGSAREVVSRMLKYFEKEGMVHIHRGSIEIINRKKLHELAA